MEPGEEARDIRRLENILRQVGILRQPGKPVMDIGLVDGHHLAFAILGLEAQLFQQLFHHGLQAAGADILDAFVHLLGNAGDGADRFGREVDGNLLGRQQGAVLLDQIGPRFRQDADEIGVRERLQFDPDRQTPLQFRQHVAGLGDMEGT